MLTEDPASGIEVYPANDSNNLTVPRQVVLPKSRFISRRSYCISKGTFETIAALLCQLGHNATIENKYLSESDVELLKKVSNSIFISVGYKLRRKPK